MIYVSGRCRMCSAVVRGEIARSEWQVAVTCFLLGVWLLCGILKMECGNYEDIDARTCPIPTVVSYQRNASTSHRYQNQDVLGRRQYLDTLDKCGQVQWTWDLKSVVARLHFRRRNEQVEQFKK